MGPDERMANVGGVGAAVQEELRLRGVWRVGSLFGGGALVASYGRRTSGWTRQACDEAILLDQVVVGRAASRPVSWAAPGA
jgi:hypothetical protein